MRSAARKPAIPVAGAAYAGAFAVSLLLWAAIYAAGKLALAARAKRA